MLPANKPADRDFTDKAAAGSLRRWIGSAGAKLLLCVVLLTLVISAFSLHTRHLAFKIRELVDRQTDLMETYDAMGDLALSMGELRLVYTYALINPEHIQNLSIESSMGIVRKYIQEIKENHPDAAAKISGNIETGYGDFLTAQKMIIAGDKKESARLIKEAQGKLGNVDGNLHELEETLHESVDDTERKVRRFLSDLSREILHSLFSGLAIIIAVATVIALDIFIPFQAIGERMIAASKDIANAERYVFAKPRSDETGTIQRALNRLLIDVAGSIRKIQVTDTISRRRLAAMEAAGDGIGIVDRDGNLIYMNKALTRLHGITDEHITEYLYKPWSNLYTAKGHDIIKMDVLPALRRDGSWRGESPIVRRNGDIVMAEMSLTLLDDGGFIGTARDITTQKRIESEREALREQFQQAQKMEAVGRLTGGIAHDFNNILMILGGNLDLIEGAASGNPELATHMKAMQAAVNRGTELTQRLLAFSRQQILKPLIHNINDVIPETLKLVARAVGEQVKIITDLGNDLKKTRVDIGQLENAILNLAINARDAMDGKGTITISTRNTVLDIGALPPHGDAAPGPYVLVSVADTGPGIPPEIVDRVFEPFFTTKDVGKGTGLGLSMVYGFVRQSGGHITIDTAPGRGTAIKLFLPVAPDKDIAEQKTVQENAPATGPVIKGGQETILIAEDEADVLDVNATLLERLGYKVVRARNGVEALEILDSGNDVDLLLTDVMMAGGINGAELAREARGKFPDLKVLFVSGYTKDRISAADLAPPGTGFLGKPYTRRQMAEALRSLLDESAA